MQEWFWSHQMSTLSEDNIYIKGKFMSKAVNQPMGVFVLIIVLLSTSMVFGQESSDSTAPPKTSFANLKKFNHWWFSMYYDESITKIINTERRDLPTDDPFFIGDERLEAHDLIVAKTKINGKSDQYYTINLAEGEGDIPHYEIYNEGNPDSCAGRFFGVALYIPGNGYVYVSRRLVQMFDLRRKFKLKDNKLVEVKQPYYYAGLKSFTHRSIKLYSDTSGSELVATVPPNYEIEVLLSDDTFHGQNQMNFLVKTSFGLVGWAKLYCYPYIGGDIEGLYYMDE